MFHSLSFETFSIIVISEMKLKGEKLRVHIIKDNTRKFYLKAKWTA